MSILPFFSVFDGWSLELTRDHPAEIV